MVKLIQAFLYWIYLKTKRFAKYRKVAGEVRNKKKYVTYLLNRFFYKIYYIYPVKKNRIVFMCFEAGKYACNPSRISEYLNEKYPGELEIIWLFKEPDKFRDLEKMGYKLARANTAKARKYLLTCKVFVYNMRIPENIPFRKNQVVISTGHGGGAYKKLLLDTPGILPVEKKLIALSTNNTTIFVSSCQKYTKCVVRGAYQYKGEVIECGLPRNDDLVNRNYKRGEKIRSLYHLKEDQKIILYAPTYRKGTRVADDYGLNAKMIAQAAKERFGGDWVVMFRMHYFIRTELDPREGVINVTDYMDMQDLIMAADILISDYSSCVWDFSLMFKPCFLFITDLETYDDVQGFYTHVTDWHFPIGMSNEDLAEKIRSFDEEDYIKGIKQHHEEMGILESGRATEILGERIYEETQKEE